MYKSIINTVATILGICIVPLDAVLTVIYGIVTIIYIIVTILLAMFIKVDLMKVKELPIYKQSFGIKSFNQFAQCACWVAQRLYIIK